MLGEWKQRTHITKRHIWTQHILTRLIWRGSKAFGLIRMVRLMLGRDLHTQKSSAALCHLFGCGCAFVFMCLRGAGRLSILRLSSFHFQLIALTAPTVIYRDILLSISACQLFGVMGYYTPLARAILRRLSFWNAGVVSRAWRDFRSTAWSITLTAKCAKPYGRDLRAGIFARRRVFAPRISGRVSLNFTKNLNP